MGFWLREIFGWLLVGIGLFVFYFTFQILVREHPGILEAVPLTFMGIVIFRGGIHLLKVAVAARICLHADRALNSAKPGRIMNPSSATSPTPVEW